MRVIECAQLSPEWWNHHKGRPSASSFDKIMTPKQCKYSSQARGYAYQLVAELVNPNPPWLSTSQQTPFRSTAMENGNNMEPEARSAYALERDVDVRQVGLCIDENDQYCCSPDGLVGEDGGLELKYPMLHTQAKYLDEGVVPSEYLNQVHGSLIVTGRKWWDFYSYAIGLPALLIRVVPDDFTEALRKCMKQFWEEYQEVKKKLGIER